MDLKLSTLTVAAALVGALSLAAVATPTAALADSKTKCYGIAKAGENDCANAAGTHSCAGHSTADYYGGDWKVAASVEACVADGGQIKALDGTNTTNA